MKATELQPGIQFKVADSCNPAELEEILTVLKIDIHGCSLSSGKFIPTHVEVIVDRQGTTDTLIIGAWVDFYLTLQKLILKLKMEVLLVLRDIGTG